MEYDVEDTGRGHIPGASVHGLVAYSQANNKAGVKQTLWSFLPESGPFVCGADSYPGSNDPSYPTTAMQLFVRSTSAQDSPAGSGCRRVQVHYLDGNLNEQVAKVALNGTARVPLPSNALRVNRLYACKDGAGLGASTAGHILVVGVSGTAIYHGMTPNRNISFSSHWTVPAGKRLGISLWTCSSAGVKEGKVVLVTLGIKRSMDGDLGDFFYGKAVSFLPNGGHFTSFRPMLFVPAGTDLRTTIEADDSCAVSMTLEGVLENA